MKNKIFVYLFALLLIEVIPLLALKNEPIFSHKQEAKIFVNNRILAKINGKPISTFDVMKKMDLNFYRQYPQYTSSTEARYQYYQMSWRFILEDLIDKELILADAKESKIEVSHGDIRQEMESSFGPNIIANLDKVGMGFEEAAKIVRDDMIMQRMISGRVHAKALRLVTPAKVRQAYELFIQDPKNIRLTKWTYDVVTVKDRNLQKTEETAKAAYELLIEGIPLEQLEGELKKRQLLSRRGKITISYAVKSNEQELSPSYREMLSDLDPGMYCQPFPNKSRSNSAIVYRILYVKEKTLGGVPLFREVEEALKGQLLDQVVDQETTIYLNKLRQHYHIRPSDLEAYVPPDYEPFLLL